MGEIFSRPAPSVPLPFTGERLTSELTGQTQIEHVHRYLLARDFCRGKRVLDAASGEGYGAALLAQVAAAVTGVDIAPDAVAHAAASYQTPNLHFVRGDARAMAIADESFDVVVSFETIEHFAEQDQFLAEIRRVLRPQGLLLVSTPDRDNYSPTNSPANPFHALELTREEFVSLLSRYFAHVDCLLQRPMIGSVMLQSAAVSANAVPLCFEKRGNEHFERSTGLARPQYVIAFASNRPIKSLPATVYIETSLLGYLEPRSNSAEAGVKLGGIHYELEAAERTIAATALDESRQQLEAERARGATELDGLRQQLEAEQIGAKTQLAELTQQLERQRAECAVLERMNERAEQACAIMRQQLAAYPQQLAECREQLALYPQQLAESRDQFAKCRQDLAAYHQQLAEAREQLAKCRQELAAYHQQLAESREQLAKCRQELAAYHQQLAESREQLAKCRRELAAYAQELAESQEELAEYRQQLADCQEHAKQKEQEVALLHTSNSWRVTAPLRAISRAIKSRQS
jgi:SAM-dependent methyltransferase/uncharacterized coiled-coil DUF342 family protein